jgi:hypothetical protein
VANAARLGIFVAGAMQSEVKNGSGSSSDEYASLQFYHRLNLTAGQVVDVRYAAAHNAAYTAYFVNEWLKIKPIRLG